MELMSGANGSETAHLFAELNEFRREQKQDLTTLEKILSDGFQGLVKEVKAMRESLVGGLLKVINTLCYCLVAIVAWVTTLKLLIGAFEKFSG